MSLRRETVGQVINNRKIDERENLLLRKTRRFSFFYQWLSVNRQKPWMKSEGLYPQQDTRNKNQRGFMKEGELFIFMYFSGRKILNKPSLCCLQRNDCGWNKDTWLKELQRQSHTNSSRHHQNYSPEVRIEEKTEDDDHDDHHVDHQGDQDRDFNNCKYKESNCNNNQETQETVLCFLLTVQGLDGKANNTWRFIWIIKPLKSPCFMFCFMGTTLGKKKLRLEFKRIQEEEDQGINCLSWKTESVPKTSISSLTRLGFQIRWNTKNITGTIRG